MNSSDAIQTWVAAAMELRSRVKQAEVAFYLYLVEGERGRCPWTGAFSSFEQLLRQFNICDAPRYASFRNALAIVKNGQQTAAEIGVDGMISSAQVQDDTRRAKVVLTLSEASRERHGVPLSFQESQRIKQSIDPVERTPLRLHAVFARAKLEEEVVSLRKRVKQLETENAKLKTENRRLKGRKGAA